jgi:hypothetical protein
MVSYTRITRGTVASIAFGLGSFVLMADITVVVITRGDQGGNIFDMGFPTPLGIAGLALWFIGITLLIFHRIRRGSRVSSSSIKPVFLRGRANFRCPKCRKMIDVSGVTFHRRHRCSCGAIYDLYQEPPDDEDNT